MGRAKRLAGRRGEGGLTRTVQRRRPSWTGSYSTWDHASTPFKPAMILRTGRVVTG